MSSTFENFVTRFNRRKDLVPALESDLVFMESALNTVLPSSYRQFVLTYGAVFTPSLLNLIVGHKLELFDVQNITSPREAVEGTTAYWSGGMPDDFIGFANDCMGNLFGFKRVTPPAVRPADAAVYVFDHDFVEVFEVAPSFEALLASYLAIPEGPV
jgi:hypothetical protein